MSILPSTLRPFPSLHSLADVDLTALSQTLRSTDFRSGAQICREGDSCDACYFLVEGEVEVITQLGDGRRIFLGKLSPGTIFGQGALVAGQLRSADVRALSNVRVLALKRLDHQWALDQGATWAVHLQKLICVNVVGQLRSALERLRKLAAGEQPEVVAPSVRKAASGAAKSIEYPDLPPGSTAYPHEPPRLKSEDVDIDLSAPPLEAHDASTTGRLLSLLAETEASFAGAGVDLGAVEVVVDEDAARRAHQAKA